MKVNERWEKLMEDSTKLGLMKVALANQIHYENLQAAFLRHNDSRADRGGNLASTRRWNTFEENHLKVCLWINKICSCLCLAVVFWNWESRRALLASKSDRIEKFRSMEGNKLARAMFCAVNFPSQPPLAAVIKLIDFRFQLNFLPDFFFSPLSPPLNDFFQFDLIW